MANILIINKTNITAQDVSYHNCHS